MARRIVLILTALFLMLPMSASAESSLSGFTCTKGGDTFIPEDFEKKVDEYREDDANMAEGFLTGQMQNLWNIGDINGISTLVFGNPYCVWADSVGKDESKIVMSPDGVFTKEERENIIDPMMLLFGSLYISLMVLSMMISGMKLGFSSVRGRGLADFTEDIKMWMISLFFIAGYGIITNLIFELNASVVLALKDVLADKGVKVNSFSLMASWKDDIAGGIPIISYVITILAEWILALVLNFVYIARKIVILVLLCMGYVAAYSLLFARTRAFFGTWLRELLGNVFIQSIHAVLLFGMASIAALGAGATYKLGLMMMFIPMTGMISKWLKIGDTSSKLGTTMTMMGLGGVMTTMALSSQAGNIIRGGSLRMGDQANATSMDMNGNTSLAGMGGGLDSGMTSISTDASGANSTAFMSTKNALSNMGGAIFGTAGMVAGPAGAAAGAIAGRNIAGALVQAPRNIASGLSHMHATLGEAKGFTNSAGQTGLKALMGNVGERRAFFGKMGESAGSMLGLGVAGRQAGHALSGVSRQRLMATSPELGGAAMLDSKGNPMAASMKNLAMQYPGADMRYVQTNKESGLFMKNPQTEAWQQVGLKGAADPLLTSGAARVVDYKLSDGQNGMQVQPNGSYKANNFSSGVNGGMSDLKPFNAASAASGLAATGTDSAIPSFVAGGNISTGAGTDLKSFVPPTNGMASSGNDLPLSNMNGGNVSPLVGPAAFAGPDTPGGNDKLNPLNDNGIVASQSIKGQPPIDSKGLAPFQATQGQAPRSNSGISPTQGVTGQPPTGSKGLAPFQVSQGQPQVSNNGGGASSQAIQAQPANQPIGSSGPSMMKASSAGRAIESSAMNVYSNQAPTGNSGKPVISQMSSSSQGSYSGSAGQSNYSSAGVSNNPVNQNSGSAPISASNIASNSGGLKTSNIPVSSPNVFTNSGGSGSSNISTSKPSGTNNNVSGPSGSASYSSAPSSSSQGSSQHYSPLPTSGLPGSTPDVMRQSNAYVVGTGGTGAVNPTIVQNIASNPVRYEDPSFNAARVNPDSFVAHSIPGAENRTGSDKAADTMNTVYSKTDEAKTKVSSKIKNSWVKKGKEERQERTRRVI